MDAFGLVVLASIGLAGFYLITSYNRLVRLKHNVKAAWSNIDVLLKQRHDELPKLVATCREYMKYEQQTLERVVAARSRVADALKSGNIGELAAGESMLHGGLGQLFALVENYPDLKSNESFQRLQSRISSLENAIADRREFYNDSVNVNNIAVEAFPTNLIAGFFKFASATLFEVDESQTGDVDVKELFA